MTICDYLFDKDKIFAYLNLDDNELFIYQRLYDLLGARRRDARSGVVPSGADRRAAASACGGAPPIRKPPRSIPIPTTCAS